jgi:hypothetical protein
MSEIQKIHSVSSVTKKSVFTLNSLLFKYLDSINKLDEEFEIRFKKIKKSDFDNVIQLLLSKKFVKKDARDTLKIQTMYNNTKTGKSGRSNIRIEINDAINIQQYCKTSNIMDYKTEELIPNIEFVNKKRLFNEEKKPYILDNKDYNFRISYQTDAKLKVGSRLVQSELNDFANKMKYFRMLKRYSFIHPDMPEIRIDLSEVRSSKQNRFGAMIPTSNIIDSDIFNNTKSYEIEIEVLNKLSYIPQDTILKQVKLCIKYILSGIQKSNFPVSQNEINDVKNDYMKLVNGDDFEYKWISPKYFIGPSSISLEMKNIQKNTTVPNIRSPYTITDKADGTRKLLFINNTGKCYFITTNMNIEFTGLIVDNKELLNTILDGEHIYNNNKGEYINLYAPFDIYMFGGEEQRLKPFIYYSKDTDKSTVRTKYRYIQLNTCVNMINKSVKYVSLAGTNVQIRTKKFVISSGEKDIFNACNKILTSDFEYETDGLIFTPCTLGVGLDFPDDTKVVNTKKTWLHSFKWKPPEFNTVDFLITTIKNKNGKDLIKNLYQNGMNNTTGNILDQYKTIELRVGFNEKIHGYINPCKNVIDNILPKYSNIDNKNSYLPVPFIPTNPVNNKTHLCNILLHNEGTDKHMFTEDKDESFENNMIVEFKYDITQKEGWKWIPIRVRHDKTEEYRNGLKNYGNAYHVAQSVWSSIHNPVTVEMITSGKNIPDFTDDDDVYYNPIGKSQTKALRDFHNLYVKNKLIVSTGKKNQPKISDDDFDDESLRGERKTLIDLAVGKAGDLSKWIKSNLRFVLGVDISKDNIENRLDGACARYLNFIKKTKGVPKCLFVNGDSGLNLKNGDGIFSEQGKKIINAVNGIGSKSDDDIGKGVRKQYGIGKNGFDVVSCQFAIHYFFENKLKLNNFLRNVSENCKVGGYFIGTSYDGLTVFNKLKEKNIGESISGYKNGKKIWEITKRYANDNFDSNDSSIGMAIDVYQETINKVFQEYLVNYSYLNDLIKLYGFELTPKEEVKKMKLPNSSGMFSELFTQMTREIKQNKKYNGEYGEAPELSTDSIQKELTFMNKYFVYKKVTDVNVEKIYDSILSGSSNPAEQILISDGDDSE